MGLAALLFGRTKMVTKKELLTGVVKFVKNEVIPHIGDRSLKMVVSAGLYAVDAKPDIVDSFFSNPLVATILQVEDGKYDTELVFKVLDNLVAEYGGIPITIPPIKFITATENTLTFRSGDVARLKEYVLKEESDA
jgi:hypothetical protein